MRVVKDDVCYVCVLSSLASSRNSSVSKLILL